MWTVEAVGSGHAWLTIKEVVHILGVLHSNLKDLLKVFGVNSDFVKTNVLGKLFAASGIQGTVLQKLIIAQIGQMKIKIKKIFFLKCPVILFSNFN